MSADRWRWHVLGRVGEVRDFGTVDMWGDLGEQQRLAERWAADKMALLLYDVEPRWERLAGWRVRIWSDTGGEAVADAEDWLVGLRSGVLARMRDRMELLPGQGSRR